MPNGNREVEAAWAYHNNTKHSFESVHSSHHFLDWQNKPLPFKVYPDLEPIPLPRPTQVSDMPALAALKGGTRETPARQTLNRTFLSTLLHYSAGITRHVRYPQGSWPSAQPRAQGPCTTSTSIWSAAISLICQQGSTSLVSMTMPYVSYVEATSAMSWIPSRAADPA